MPISTIQRAACAHAAATGLPFALWRAPHGEAFTAIVSTQAPVVETVFDPQAAPGFAMAPFQTEDGGKAWMLRADVLVEPDALRFLDGRTFVDAPVTPEQARIAGSIEVHPVRAPEASGDAPVPTEREEYMARVARAVAAIRSGPCEKIVLSRIEPRDLPQDRDLCDLAEALAAIHPHAFVSLVSSQPTGTWLTATPEILLTADDASVRTMALAGTQWPEPGVEIDALTWPQKIVDEQALVADFIREAFAAEGFDELQETAPATVRAANLCHLRSDFAAPVRDAAALSGLLRRLHPTSAVCGTPKDEAREFILQEEGATRGFYTGYLGPRNIDGGTGLYVNLRSARIAGSKIFLHVGGGILAASDPRLEWDETVEKTKTIACVL